MRRFLVLALTMLTAAVMAIPAPAGAAPKNPKTTVCHVQGNGTFIPIEVAEKAVPAHLGHGDGLIGGDVPGMDGYLFGEACEFVEKNTPPVAYDGTAEFADLSDYAFDADDDFLTFYIINENPESNANWILIQEGGPGYLLFSASCSPTANPTSSFQFYVDDGQDLSNVATMTVPCRDVGGGSI